MRRPSWWQAAALMAVVVLEAGCSADAPVTAPENPRPSRPELAGIAIRLTADVQHCEVTVGPPISGPSASAGEPAGTGRAGGQPSFALLGRNEVGVTTSNFSCSDVGEFLPGKVRIRFDVALTNRLTGAALVTPTFPPPPLGEQGLLLFPFSVSEISELGEVAASTDWDGDLHNFFNDNDCSEGRGDCYRYEPYPSPLGPGATSEARTVGFDIDPQVRSFQLDVVLAADLEDRVPSLPPGPVGLDAEFAGLAQEVPGFGGLFLDENGAPTVNLMDPGQLAAVTQALAASRLGGELRARGIPLDQIGVRQGQYDFLQLTQWRERLSIVWSIPGVVLTDIDEHANRLRIGVAHAAALSAVEEEVTKLQIPREAVIVEETAPMTSFAVSLRDRVRLIGGGLEIATQKAAGCTLGFNARLPGSTGLFFVINSHCTPLFGQVDFTPVWQRRTTPLDLLGAEVRDPPGVPCLRVNPVQVRLCRFSDASLIEYEPDVAITDVRFGSIMRTTSFGQEEGSLEIDLDQPRFFIVAEARFPMMGEVLNKVGRTTGWTQGKVGLTCFDGDRDGLHLLKCQDVLEAGGNFGDSGSPVFRLNDDGTNVTLYGLVWGGDPGRQVFFSPMGGIEEDFGNLLSEVGPLEQIQAAGLLNTGVDDAGAVLPAGSPELHYALTGPQAPAEVTDPLVAPGATWVTPPAGSAWIGPRPSTETAPEGQYHYTLTFDLPEGVIPQTASISADVSADNVLDILVNGRERIIGRDPNQFRELTPLRISSGFVSGRNTLEFRVTNTEAIGPLNPSGLVVANLRLTARRPPP
jgi:hypothetical protein